MRHAHAERGEEVEIQVRVSPGSRSSVHREPMDATRVTRSLTLARSIWCSNYRAFFLHSRSLNPSLSLSLSHSLAIDEMPIDPSPSRARTIRERIRKAK